MPWSALTVATWPGSIWKVCGMPQGAARGEEFGGFEPRGRVSSARLRGSEMVQEMVVRAVANGYFGKLFDGWVELVVVIEATVPKHLSESRDDVVEARCRQLGLGHRRPVRSCTESPRIQNVGSHPDRKC